MVGAGVPVPISMSVSNWRNITQAPKNGNVSVNWNNFFILLFTTTQETPQQPLALPPTLYTTSPLMIPYLLAHRHAVAHGADRRLSRGLAGPFSHFLEGLPAGLPPQTLICHQNEGLPSSDNNVGWGFLSPLGSDPGGVWQAVDILVVSGPFEFYHLAQGGR